MLLLALQDVDVLIERLGAPTFEARRQAVDDLVRRGKAAVPALRRAAESPDPEVAARAREALERIRFGGLFDARGNPDPATEAALDWLARHQAVDGSWAGAFACCPGKGPSTPDPGVTGLAALAFLAAGRKPSTCEPLRKALARLLAWQEPDGRIGPAAEKGMYGHVIGALALAEGSAYGEAEALRTPAQRAADWTAAARDPKFGWRYVPRSPETDSSVTIWATLSLAVGRRVGLQVPEEAFRGAGAWLDAATDEAYGRTVYRLRDLKCSVPSVLEPEFAPHLTLTGGAAFVRRMLGPGARAVKAGDLLPRDPPSVRRGEVDYLHWHFGALGLLHTEGPEGKVWTLWGAALKAALSATRRDEGCAAGSWDPADAWSPEGGRAYATAINALTLETTRRYRAVGGIARPR